MPVLILEGISRCGKTSWLDRNRVKLDRIFEEVCYRHVHQTPYGWRLKEKYLLTKDSASDKDREELGTGYLVAHLQHAIELNTELKENPRKLLVVDRSIVSTLAIQGVFADRRGAFINPYLDLLTVDEKTPYFLFFDTRVRQKRYEEMYDKSFTYRSIFINNIGVPRLEVDASCSMEEVDLFSTPLFEALERREIRG